jgi:hypothetical protein
MEWKHVATIREFHVAENDASHRQADLAEQ